MWERRSSEPASERLALRRRRGRIRALIVLGAFLLIVLGAFVWLTWQSSLRVAHIEINPSDPGIESEIKNALAGAYAGIVPRDSFFFVPEGALRSLLLRNHSDIEAVSIAHVGLTGLRVDLISRAAVGTWCGLMPTPAVPEYCYFFDDSGFVYEPIDASSTKAAINPFKIYAPLMGNTEEPLRATITHAHDLPAVFDFARQVGTFGSSVVSIIFRGDEVDCLLASGTRITYVLGSETQALTDLVSAKNNVALSSGTLDYVDLRFPGKVYIKKK